MNAECHFGIEVDIVVALGLEVDILGAETIAAVADTWLAEAVLLAAEGDKSVAMAGRLAVEADKSVAEVAISAAAVGAIQVSAGVADILGAEAEVPAVGTASEVYLLLIEAVFQLVDAAGVEVVQDLHSHQRMQWQQIELQIYHGLSHC